MTSGQYEAVTVEPVGVLGVVLHDLVVENMSHRGTAHGKTRVTRIGLLYGIDGQESDCVYGLLNQRSLGSLVKGLNGGSSNGSARVHPATWDPRWF